MHRHADETIQLFAGCFRQQAFRPGLIVTGRVAVQEAPEERDHGDTLQVTSPLGRCGVLLITHDRLEAMRVEQRFRGQRRDHLTEPNVRFRERLRVAIGSEEDGADRGGLPSNREHNDRANVARVELFLDRLELRIGSGVGDEDSVAGLEGALQFGITVEIDDQVSDGRVLVTGHEANLVLFAGQEDRGAVEPERIAEFSGDGLEDVDEVEGGGDLLQDVDDRNQVVALALEFGYAGLETEELVIPPIGFRSLRRAG